MKVETLKGNYLGKYLQTTMGGSYAQHVRIIYVTDDGLIGYADHDKVRLTHNPLTE